MTWGTVKLNDGRKLPEIGWGSWKVGSGDTVVDQVRPGSARRSTAAADRVPRSSKQSRRASATSVCLRPCAAGNESAALLPAWCAEAAPNLRGAEASRGSLEPDLQEQWILRLLGWPKAYATHSLPFFSADTAQTYGNETEVGDGIRESGLDRKDIWLTTKW